MTSVKIGNAEAPSPAYGLGTAHFGRGAGKVDEELVQHVVEALKAGFTHLDNAEGYNNEVSTGEALRKSGVDRSTLFITHKVTKSVDQVRKTLEKQLENLGVSSVDLLLVHDPTEAKKHDLTQAEVWTQMEEVHSLGLAKAIGVSNFRISDLDELLKTAKVKPAVNQIEIHAYLQTENDELVEYCSQHGIVIESYNGNAPLTKLKGGPVDEVVERIAKERSISETQVLMLWTKRYIHDGIVVTTSSKPSRMAEMVAFAHLEPLSDVDFRAISDAGRKLPLDAKRRIYMAHTAK